jgi:hypothetical protein
MFREYIESQSLLSKPWGSINNHDITFLCISFYQILKGGTKNQITGINRYGTLIHFLM